MLFSLSVWQLWFIISTGYTLIIYFFFNDKLIQKVINKTGFPEEVIRETMKWFYVVSIFLGIFFLVIDFINWILWPSKSIWSKEWDEE